MEKRTLLAVVLSMGVMLVFFIIQDIMFPRQPLPPPEQQARELPGQAERGLGEAAMPLFAIPPGEEADAEAEAFIREAVPLQELVVETGRIRVVLSNAWGNIVSFQLLNHLDRGEPVEMIFTGEAPSRAFAVAFGNIDDAMAGRIVPEQRNFRVRRVSPFIVEFSQDFGTPAGGYFTMTKRYEFTPDEYMFELTTTLEGGPGMHYFNFQGAAYTIMFGPQIGPSFRRLTGRHHEEFRTFRYFERGGRRGRLRTENLSGRNPAAVISTLPSWAAIEGKYFALVVMPLTPNYDIGFSIRDEEGLSDASRMYISRPPLIGSRHEGRYRFYFGPKNQQSLIIYERGDNAFGLRDTGLSELARGGSFPPLAPLERGLKWLLTFFYTRTISNYGVAIIFLTIFVKVVLFPLTKKASEGTLRMQALAPKIKEIQERNKGNPQKMNMEMGEFYKREGYNPISGCLPMLIQLPIFLAMFGLFSTHFELRGAVFIPGWIVDLSAPEYVFMSETFALPLLGWDALRILPFIYVGSQLLYGKAIQTPAQMGNPMMMKMMLYGMPLIFFFVLYNMPSGLLVYWIMSNILTMVQQVGINKYMARRKALMAAAEPPKPVIAPGGARKKKKK